MNTESMLKNCNLPPLCDREKMKEILQQEVYGYLPDIRYSAVFSASGAAEQCISPNKAYISKIDMTIKSGVKSHTIPLSYLSYKDGKKHPLFIFLSFSPTIPNRYYPAEMIAERGFNVISFCYTDAASDDSDFSNGIAPILLPGGQKKATDCGKIAMWAWCAMRALDYAVTLPETDASQIAVFGHSRLGKTALFAGMMDTRFRYVCSNNAGCAGDTLYRGNIGLTGKKGPGGNTGETIKAITATFPYWFCKNYRKYSDTNIPENFDQHFLLASIAPRFLSVSASSLDDWADPVAEQLCCMAASKKWEDYGIPGLIHENKLLKPGERIQEGRISFSMREGIHFLSYHNWLWNMDFIDLHKNDLL